MTSGPSGPILQVNAVSHAFGPRLAAVLSYLSGSQYVSQRGLEDVCEVVFGVPVSLGSITALP